MLYRLALFCLLITTTVGCASVQKSYAPGAADAISRTAQERVLIRSGSLNLRVKVPESIRPNIEEIAADIGGRVQEWSSQEDKWLNMTLRVPEPRLDEAMDRIAKLGKVVGRSLQARDVTEQLIDLEARLKNLRALRDRLRSYLEQATNLSEILEVERELTRVQSEVEALEAKLKILKDRVSMSELVVRVSNKRWF